MNRTIALAAAAAFLASTTLVTAFYAPAVQAPSNVQLVQTKEEMMKKEEAMKKEEMMKKEEAMKKEEMMKKDAMKKK
jgi:predicted GIY-YIG superfamily endonuclease